VKMIRLSGLFDVSLGGFPCIRGYAKLGDLARCSKPDEGYQRDLLSDHRGEIKNFLSDRDNLFFPEIILSCKLQYDFTKPGAISGLNPIRDILNKEKFRSNIDGISIAFRKDANLATLTINEMMDKTPLNRVDGNHRLSAVELNKDFEEYNTPFCILLLSDDPSGEQKDKIIFHNINFKAVPLEEELSLKIILEDSKLFPDDILKKPNLGWEYYLTRKILEHESILEDISVLKKQKYRTLLKSSIKILLDRKGVPKKDTSVKHILDVLKSLDFLCKSKPYLGRNSSIFSALICVHTENPTLVNSFVSWIEGTHMYDLQKLSVESGFAPF